MISTSEMSLTQELHIIRAHHLHYSSLLDNFRKTVEFVRDTLNPALESLSEEDRAESKLVMKRETHTLLSEIERLNKTRDMQDKRLKNVMNLVCFPHAVLYTTLDVTPGNRYSAVSTLMTANV